MIKSKGLFDNDLDGSPQKNKIIGANLIFKFIFLNYGNRFWPRSPMPLQKAHKTRSKMWNFLMYMKTLAPGKTHKCIETQRIHSSITGDEVSLLASNSLGHKERWDIQVPGE